MTDKGGNNRDIFILIRELAKAIRFFQDGAVFCENITFTQFVILDYTKEKGTLKLSDLHSLLAVEKSTTTRLIEPLVQKGLIRKEKSLDDSRALELELTAEGKRIYQSVSTCLTDHVDQLLHVIPEEEQNTVIGSLSTFVRAMFRCCGKEGCCR